MAHYSEKQHAFNLSLLPDGTAALKLGHRLEAQCSPALQQLLGFRHVHLANDDTVATKKAGDGFAQKDYLKFYCNLVTDELKTFPHPRGKKRVDLRFDKLSFSPVINTTIDTVDYVLKSSNGKIVTDPVYTYTLYFVKE